MTKSPGATAHRLSGESFPQDVIAARPELVTGSFDLAGESMPNPLIYLASASPRRAALLTQLRLDYHVEPVAIDESHAPEELPAEYVVRLARAKAESLWEQLPAARRAPVLGADTTVALEGAVFGKPLDRTHGLTMLQSLAGKTHQVYTAVALRHAEGCDWRVSVSDVTFAPLTAAECAAYWDTGEPCDKAGSYAIQGLAATFITRLGGSYSGVVGLPLYETVELLRQIGWTMPAPLKDDVGLGG